MHGRHAVSRQLAHTLTINLRNHSRARQAMMGLLDFSPVLASRQAGAAAFSAAWGLREEGVRRNPAASCGLNGYESSRGRFARVDNRPLGRGPPEWGAGCAGRGLHEPPRAAAPDGGSAAGPAGGGQGRCLRRACRRPIWTPRGSWSNTLPIRRCRCSVWLRFLTGQRLMAIHRQHLGAQKRDAKQEVALHRPAGPEVDSQSLSCSLFGRMTSPSMAAIRVELQVRLQAGGRRLGAVGPRDPRPAALRGTDQPGGGRGVGHHLGGRQQTLYPRPGAVEGRPACRAGVAP